LSWTLSSFETPHATIWWETQAGAVQITICKQFALYVNDLILSITVRHDELQKHTSGHLD